MKKWMLMSIISIICLFVFAQCIVYTCPNNNDNVSINIKDVSVVDCCDEKYKLYFQYYGWSEELEREVEENPDSYIIVSVSYLVENKSDTIEMQDIRFKPNFVDDLNNLVKVYNEDNGTYYIFARPMSSCGMTQRFLIEKGKQTNEYILQMLNEQKIKLIYYTGSMKVNTGHGYWGIGKHEYEFCMDTCQSDG